MKPLPFAIITIILWIFIILYNNLPTFSKTPPNIKSRKISNSNHISSYSDYEKTKITVENQPVYKVVDGYSR